jgi:protein-S-isoprenylcysteine O-methyltransferase Ste14
METRRHEATPAGMTNNFDGLNGQIFKYRGLLWGIFVLAVFIFPASYSASRIFVSAPLLAAGQLLRFWAAGVIPKYRTLTLDAPELVTYGPYAWVRNPLYAGNALMGCGWAVMAGWLWLPIFAAAYFVIYTLAIIPYEERFLLEKFKEEYLAYRNATPSMIPGIKNLRERAAASRSRFGAKKSWFMERHSLRMNILVTVLIIFRILAKR